MTKGLIAIVVLFSLLLAACSNQTATPTAVPAPSAAAAPPTDDLAKLRANTWEWVAYKGPTEIIATVSDTPDYSLTFNADGGFALKADCNNAAGNYQAADGKLTITLGPVTKAACVEGSHSEKLLKLLPGAALYRFDGNDLIIDLMADGGTLTFIPLR
jgi:heat shock protein HslJ